MRRTRDVHDLLRAAEFVDRFRHKALRPGFSRTLDLRDTVPARALGFLEDAGVGFREFFVGEQRAGPRHFIVRQVDGGRRRPVLAEQLLNDLDGRRRTLDQRIAVAGVGDRRLQHVAQPHRAVIAQQQHPGFERAGDAGGEQAGAGHHLQAFALVMRDGGFRGRGALAADHLGAAAFGVMDDDRHVAAGTVQMRLDHLQRKGGGDTGVEGVAAFFQDAHADGGSDPMRRSDHTKGAFDFRPCGERIGIDVAHGNPVRWWYCDAGALDHRRGWMPTAGMPRIAPISVIIPRRWPQPDG